MNIRLGSRGSALALAQVDLFLQAFKKAFPGDVMEVEVVQTTGDRKQETSLAGVSDKREWIHELEQGIVNSDLDLALHSGKDVPSEVDERTELLPVLPRATPFDCFIGRTLDSGARLRWRDLPPNARIGTASLRRRAQLCRLNRDIELVELRGNVGTRLRKLDEGQADGIVLAAAGLERLQELSVEVEDFPATQMLPAVNQGMLCVQFLKGNISLKGKLERLVSPGDKACFEAERRVAELLEGDCHSAIGIFAKSDEARILLRAEVYSHDGERCLSASGEDSHSNSLSLGEKVAKELLSQGASQLLHETQ